MAAAAVFGMHARAMFFADRPAQLHLGVLGKAAFYLTGLGHQAVVIFFVLSGFLVGGSALRSHAEGRWSWTGYAIPRVARLYVVLVPALLLTAAWDNAGLALFNTAAHPYASDLRGAAISKVSLNSGLTLRAFLGNHAFLQNVRVPCFGTDFPLWSLACEGWFYVLFPLVLAAVLPGRASGRVLAAAGALVVGWFFPFWPGFLIWCFGAAVAAITHRTGRGAATVFQLSASAIVFGASVHVTRADLSARSDIFLGVAFALFLWALLGLKDRQAARPGIAGVAAKRLADMSYTLYCVHSPVLAFAQAALVGDVRWQFRLGPAVVASLVAALVFVYAFAVAHVTEARTPALRAWLTRKLAVLQTT
jgi:peptidoglycan/LPS O-acetylase OafA/YrhL